MRYAPNAEDRAEAEFRFRLVCLRGLPRWAMDVTYIPMRRGFVYLAAVLDWATQRVLAWRLSNSMTVDFCLDALEAAIRDYGPPGILNTDQGSQFTGTAFVGVVQQHSIQPSMDGRGAWRDNLTGESLI